MMPSAFQSVQKGDALIQEGHTFLAAANSTSAEVIYVYEQTPGNAIYTSYSYETLANGEFIPFSK